jgi:hypothetical protein
MARSRIRSGACAISGPASPLGSTAIALNRRMAAEANAWEKERQELARHRNDPTRPRGLGHANPGPCANRSVEPSRRSSTQKSVADPQLDAL